jgi:hypothetical protein
MVETIRQRQRFVGIKVVELWPMPEICVITLGLLPNVDWLHDKRARGAQSNQWKKAV